MRIEDAIHVAAFPSVYQKVSINLIYTMTWADVRLQEFFGEFGLTSSQYNVLRILRGQHPKPVSTALIRDRMIHRNAGVSRLVDRLAEKGFLVKSTCEKDRRLVDVVITEAGLSVLKQMDDQKARIDAIYANLSEEEAGELSRLLDKIRE
jgi:DNA-binding MarR family transcriptional regulator